MKKISFLTFLALLAFAFLATDATAQKFPALDPSPHDIASFKDNDGTVMKVIYGRPQKNDRAIFGSLVPFGKVWRTGANEATEITFYKNVVWEGQEVEAGTYTLFTIPNEDSWTIILNSELNQWGSYRYNEKTDVLRMVVTSSTIEDTIESFSMTFKKKDNGASLLMGWENTVVEIPIEF